MPIDPDIDAILKSRDRLILRLRAARDEWRTLALEKEAVIQESAERIDTLKDRLARPNAPKRAFIRCVEFISKTSYPLGVLRQYAPRPIRLDSSKIPGDAVASPGFCILTPSFSQGRYIESTIRSVVDQDYPKLRYGVQDGGSKDETLDILKKYADRLAYKDSRPDEGQAAAINFGFQQMQPRDGEIMAWLNSDDLLTPGTLQYVGEYFARHPEVDAIYGHRIVIDDEDREIGRWFLPAHDKKTLKYADYVPQETLFWRASAYQKVNGLDSSFQFAMDWDFLLRLEAAGCTIVRLPRFLGCFRVHKSQKTSAAINDIGALEMSILRTRTHGRDLSCAELRPHILREVSRSARVYRLHQLGFSY